MRAVRYTAFREPPEVVTVDDTRLPGGRGRHRGRGDGSLPKRLARAGWVMTRRWRCRTCRAMSSRESIAEVGAEVEGWRAGERVTVPFVCACGRCPTCLRGEQQVCDFQFQPGFTQWGSFAERVAIDRADVNLVRIPDDMDLETAASLGCRFSTAYRAVVHHGRGRHAGDWVVVHGCGGVGLSAVMIATAHGARVIAVDVSPAALELARDLGAIATIDANLDGRRRGGPRDDARGSAGVAGCLGQHHHVSELHPQPAQARTSCPDRPAWWRTTHMPPVPMAEVIAGELELVGSHGMAAHAYPAMLAEIVDGHPAPRATGHPPHHSRRGAGSARRRSVSTPATASRWSSHDTGEQAP